MIDGQPIRQIRISFANVTGSVIADLLDEDAPNTCNALWQLLPLRVAALHDIWSGHVIRAHLDNSIVLPPENVLSYIPMPGDIFYYYRPSHYVRGAPYGRYESAELGFVYDRDSRPQGPRGAEAVNFFASISSGLELFTTMGSDMIAQGTRDMLIERVS